MTECGKGGKTKSELPTLLGNLVRTTTFSPALTSEFGIEKRQQLETQRKRLV